MKAVCFVGWSGSGKTTLVERLVPVLAARGHAVGYLKSHEGEFAMDREGKDTDRLYRAGASRVAIASSTEAALRWRLRSQSRRDPRELLRSCFADCDIVLVEGFKDSDLNKIEVRSAEPLAAERVIAVVSPERPSREEGLQLPRFAPDDIDGLARFVEEAPLD